MIDHNDKLLVFERFHEDLSLSKFANKGPTGQVASAWLTMDTITVGAGGEVRIVGAEAKARPRFSLWRWLRGLFGGFAPPSRVLAPMTVLEFFSSIKNSQQELSVVKERAAGYEKSLKTARATGQQALVEQLESGLVAHRAETQLVAMGLSRFVTEADLVRFYKQSERGLRLDWIKNFTRIIPEPVVALKARADELELFDNYVVLHYDPDAKAYAETEKEREARRDPILFGLMKGRRILYVVGDWVDEICDLTLDQIADKLGAEAVRSL